MSPNSEHPEAPPRGDETVLVVDDEPGLLRVAALVLGQAGYMVLSASSVSEAIAARRERSDGIQFFRGQILRHLTSSKEQSDVMRSYQLGVNSYIVKPVNCDGFTGTVRELRMCLLLLNRPPVLTA